MSVLLALTVITSQWAAGAAAWWLIARRARLLEVLGGGLALGTAASALSGVIAWPILGPVWSSLLPQALMLLVLATVGGLRYRRRGRQPAAAVAPGTSTRLAVDRWEMLAVTLGLVIGTLAIAVNLGRYPLDIASGSTSFHQDMVFFQPLSRSLAMVGPDDSIFMAGFPLHYHWLSYAWAGDLDAIAGTQPFLVLTRLLPFTTLIAGVLLIVAWSRRLSASRWVASLAVVLLISGGYVGATYGTILNFDSPSQEFSTVWMLGLGLALWHLLGSAGEPAVDSPAGLTHDLEPARWQRLLSLILVALLAAAATGGKVSASATLLSAWCLLVLVAIVRRSSYRWWALGGAVIGGLSSWWFLTRYIAGSAQGGGIGLGSLLERASSVQGLNPMAGTLGIATGTAILGLAIAERWAGLVWLVHDRRTRWSPGSILGVGLAIVGLATVLLLSGGLNDTWFALAASAPLCAISAWGVRQGIAATTRPASPGRRAMPWAISIITGIVLLGLVLILWTLGPNTGTNLRWAGPVVAIVGAVLAGALIARSAVLRGSAPSRILAIAIVVLVTMAALSRVLGLAADRFGVPADNGRRTSEFLQDGPFLGIRDAALQWTWSADQAAAGAWLAAQGQLNGNGGLVATNQTRSPLVAMLSGRQTLVSAVQYQVPYGTAWRQGDALVRDGDSWRFIDTPSAEHARKLCGQGVRWVWVDPAKTRTRSWDPYAAVVFERPDVIILRLSASVCPES